MSDKAVDRIVWVGVGLVMLLVVVRVVAAFNMS